MLINDGFFHFISVSSGGFHGIILSINVGENNERIWMNLYNAAKKVLNPRRISEIVEAGGVAAEIESESGKIYLGVCVDESCALGICAERNAIFNMITNGESGIKKVIALNWDGKALPPCGACRELMTQLMPMIIRMLKLCLIMKET